MSRHVPDDMASDLTTDQYDAAVVLATDGTGTDIGGEISPETSDDPRSLSVWLVAMHLYHVTKTARESGGDVSPGEVAAEAVEMLSESIEDGGGNES